MNLTDYERQANVMANLRQSTTRRRDVESQLRAATTDQASDIRSAFALEVPLRTLVHITGLSAARLYQIRDGVKSGA